MNFDQVVAHYGGGDYGAQTRAADRLGISLTTLHSWKARGIPRQWQLDIQLATRGKLKAIARRRKLPSR